MATITPPSMQRRSRTGDSLASGAGKTKATQSYRHALIGDVSLASRTLDQATDVTLSLPVSEWERIRNTTKRTNVKEAMFLESKREREALHQTSMDMVRTWDNTLEGQRQKKLERLKLRAEKDEVVSKKLDVEEAQYQAERRKEAIAKAREGLMFQTDRVKKFHESIVLADVLREREAQVEMKCRKEAMRQGMDHQYVQRMREDHRQAILQDKEKAWQRHVAADHTLDFQRQQMYDKRQQELEERRHALKEQLESNHVGEQYHEEQRELERQQALGKVETRRSHDRTLEDKRAAVAQKQLEDGVENDEIKKFSVAKQTMVARRKRKERALQQGMRDKQDAMCDKLHGMALKQRDTEEQEITQAQAEKYAKRDREVKEKQDRFMQRQLDINEHRVKVMKAHGKQKQREAATQNDMAQQQRDMDIKFYAEQRHEETRKRRIQHKFQDDVIQQVHDRLNREETEIQEQIEHAKLNHRCHLDEEDEFQCYASMTITEMKRRGAPTYVMERAAKTAACGGHGPAFDSKGGIKPSYQAMDSFGTELKGFGESRLLPAASAGGATAHGKSQPTRGLGLVNGDTKKRTGFVW